MIEKRKTSRHKTCILAGYKRLDKHISTWQVQAEVKNISLGGMLFSAYEKLPVETPLLLKVQIFTGDSAVTMVELHGRVVEVKDGIISYDTRVGFTDVDNLTEIKLKRFVDYISW